jgi:hypothetical protein
MKKQALLLAAILFAGNLKALEPFYLDSSPGAPYPFNPCPYCSTDTNSDGSIQVHDPLPARSFSSFSSEAADDDQYPDLGKCRVVFTAHVNSVDWVQDCLTTNGYTNHVFQFWTGGLPGPVWDTSTNFEWEFTIGEGASSPSSVLMFDHLFPSMSQYDLITVEAFANFPDASFGHDIGSFPMYPRYTTGQIYWLVFLDGAHDRCIIDGYPQNYRDEMPWCFPVSNMRNTGGGFVHASYGGLTPNTDYPMQSAPDINGPWTDYPLGGVSTDDFGYGETPIEMTGDKAFFRLMQP